MNSDRLQFAMQAGITLHIDYSASYDASSPHLISRILLDSCNRFVLTSILLLINRVKCVVQ